MKTFVMLILGLILVTPQEKKLSSKPYKINDKLIKVDVSQKDKSIAYYFEINGNKSILKYSFLKNSDVIISFNTGSMTQTISMLGENKLVYQRDSKKQEFTLSQRKMLFSKLSSQFTEMLKRNYLDKNMGFSMLKDSNHPVAQDFVDELPLVKILRKIKKLAMGGDGCFQEVSCPCVETTGESQTFECPCGSIPKCQESIVIVCYTDANGETSDCVSQETCIPVCLTPQEPLD